MKQFLLAGIVAVTLSPTVGAQELSPAIEIGANASGFVYHGDLSDRQLGNFKDLRFGAGIYGKYFLNPILSLKANLYRGSLSGDDGGLQDEWRKKRAYTFRTPLTEFSVMVEADIFGKGRFHSLVYDGRHRRRWGAYVNAGVGVAFTNASRNWSGLDRQYFYKDAPENIPRDSANVPDKVVLVIPMGLGVRYDVSKRISVFAEAGYRFTITDNLDGYKYSVYSSKYDGYTVYSAGCSYRFHSKRKYKAAL